MPPIKAHQRAIAEQIPGRFEHTTAVESCPKPDEEISRWRTDFNEQVTYLDAMHNAKSFDKVVWRDGRPVAVDGYHQHFAGKLVVKRCHATVERQHTATEGRTDLRITGSEIRINRQHDSALEYREYRRGFGGTGVGIEIPKVGEGWETTDEKVVRESWIRGSPDSQTISFVRTIRL